MLGEVNKIIFNMLISGRGVYLPQIGTLYIERRGAKKIAKNRLIAPRNAVSFTTQVQAPSLVEEIASIAKCDIAQAEDIYTRWQAKTQEGNKLTIEGIGRLIDKSFTAEDSFKRTINPEGVKTIIIRRRSHSWLYILCGVCVVIALGILAYILWGESLKSTQPTPTATAPATHTQVVAEPKDSLSTSTTAEPASEQTATAEVTAPANKEYAHYVVMGIFANEDNATRAVEQVKSKIEDADCVIIPFKNKHMVTVFGSDSRADCNTFAASYRDIYPDLWIYDKE